MTIFGVQTWIGPDPEKNPSGIYKIGCRETRIDLRWSWIEPTRPDPVTGAHHYDWAHTDNIVRLCAQASLRPLPILYLPPEWADNGRGVPSNFSTWATFCYQCAARYGPGGSFWTAPENQSLPQLPITLYEIGNEPNFWTWVNGKCYPHGDKPIWNGYPEEYVTVFSSAALGIRARGNEIGEHLDVMIGGLGFREPGHELDPCDPQHDPPGSGAGVWNPFNFLDIVKANGISTPDAVGFHPYGWNNFPNGAAPSAASAYGNTNGRIKRMVTKLHDMGWANVGVDITEDGIPIDATPNNGTPSSPYSESDRYSYFHDTVINIKNTYQTSSPPVRRYCAFAWTRDNNDPSFNIAREDLPYAQQDPPYDLLPAGQGYWYGING